MRPRFLVGVTGPPGCGKTTAVEKAVEILRREECMIAGILSKEVRVAGGRVGFDIIDVETGERRSLARVSGEEGARLGRYRVYTENLDDFAVGIIEEALTSRRIIVVDEVGPMELMSHRFRETLRRVLREAQRAILTLHYYSRDPLVLEARRSVSELVELRRGDALAVAERVAKMFIEGR